ncbi:hypothetical protein dsx2_0024 [Desulfovibrio sp. X2]|uniref:hypothetical protein n=1 Tax=Desulfovibrio sp. X2 TaxID=941449 RepID=UPI000358E9A2|nr:hypothetical protein [Desulfovibrio sp. X2]EPR43800.1 hypothetical protein dsx2_0024 [Desulfovibrio sp. X2]
MKDSLFQLADQSQIAVWLLIVAALLVLAVILARRLRHGDQDLNPLLVNQPEGILDILRQAAVRKHRFEMRIRHGLLEDRLLSTMVLDVTPDRMTVELPANVRPSKVLVGLTAEGYVTGKTQQGMSFYSFRTQILDVGHKAEDQGYVVLAVPAEMQLYSRRSALRTVVPDGYLLGVQAWTPGPMASGEPLEPATLGKPLLSWRKGQGGSVRLLDLSGNGLRLGNVPVPPGGRDMAEVSRHVVVCLDLTDPGSGDPARHWLACEVRNESPRREGYEDVGLRIEGFAVDEGEGRLVWQRLEGGSEVPVLGGWVFRYHLIAHRQAIAEAERGA